MDECDMNFAYARRLRYQQQNSRPIVLYSTEEIENQDHLTDQERPFVHSTVFKSPVKKLSTCETSRAVVNTSSPSGEDRFLPHRQSEKWFPKFTLLPGKEKIKINSDEDSPYPEYNILLKNEILGTAIVDVCDDSEQKLSTSSNFFGYSNKIHFTDNESIESLFPYSLSPISPSSQSILRALRKTPRKISKAPYKILDAPDLHDDFYLHLVDWSSQNMLGVGLGSCLYLWSAYTSQVTKLCDLSNDNNLITSVAWNPQGNLIAIGTHFGYILVWDTVERKLLEIVVSHSKRVGVLAWNGNLLASGSRDRIIMQRDIRCIGIDPLKKLCGHTQEVCGLKWSPDNQHLASGGNDNQLHIWNMHSATPLHTFTDHTAAIKAIDWSPHQHGLIASGGGTADRCIRFWNILTRQSLKHLETGSQVCNLAWSKHTSELISTHGYSQNHISIWKYPSLTQTTKLTGHSSRVLYLSMSPDGESIVTGAGDETLRFWKVFPKATVQKKRPSVLNLYENVK